MEQKRHKWSKCIVVGVLCRGLVHKWHTAGNNRLLIGCIVAGSDELMKIPPCYHLFYDNIQAAFNMTFIQIIIIQIFLQLNTRNHHFTGKNAAFVASEVRNMKAGRSTLVPRQASDASDDTNVVELRVGPACHRL